MTVGFKLRVMEFRSCDGCDHLRSEYYTQRRAMGIDWMSLPKLSQAVPPAYSEFLAAEAICQSIRASSNPAFQPKETP